MSELHLDVAIFGGGVAGLWTLHRLRKLGYSAVSIASQGILHGGTKYALTGKQTASSEAVAAMPAIWKSCLAGEGPIDLSNVKVLADNQLLWTSKNLGSKLTGCQRALSH